MLMSLRLRAPCEYDSTETIHMIQLKIDLPSWSYVFQFLLSDEAPMIYEISSFTIQKGKADEQCLILCQCFVFFFLINTREN